MTLVSRGKRATLLLRGISRAKQYRMCFIMTTHQKAMELAVLLLSRFMFLTFCQGSCFFFFTPMCFNSGVKVEQIPHLLFLKWGDKCGPALGQHCPLVVENEQYKRTEHVTCCISGLFCRQCCLNCLHTSVFG